MLATGKELRLCKEIAHSLCPDIQMIETGREQWSHDLIEEPKGVRLFVWNDGIRDQILIIQGNGEKLTRSKNSKLSKLFINLCCGSAELDCWPSRLHVAQNQTHLKSFILAKHSGRWNAEASIFTSCKSIPLNGIKKKPFVWVGGVEASEVNSKLIEDIINVASTGSTVLVESIGGQGHFASMVQQKLAEKTRVLVEPAHGLQQFTGRRAWSILNQQVLPTPLSASIGKGTVLFIDCDLRNALRGHTAWGVHGYSTQSANELVQYLLCQ